MLATIVVALALVVNARLAAMSQRRVTEADATVRHTHDVRETLQGLLLSLQDAETSERGFIITGDVKYLQPYSEGRTVALGRLEKLGKLTSDDPSQQRLVSTMRPLVVQKLDVLERAIHLRRTAPDGPRAARAIVQAGEGKRLMDALRVIVADMEATENQLLMERMRTSAIATRNARWTNLLGLCASILLLTAAFAVWWRRTHERERAAVLLRDEKEKFRTTLTSIGDGVVVTDSAGRVTMLNETAAAILGWNEEALGKPIDEVFRIVNEQTRRTVESPVAKVLRDGKIAGLANHTVVIRRDGGDTPIDDSGAPIRDQDGSIVGVVLVFRDITERRHKEEALRESEQRFRLMADTAPVLIWLSGPDKLCTWFNRRWLEFVGRTMEQELGDGWADNVHPDDLERCLDTYVTAFDARQPFSMEYRLRRHDGEYRHLIDNGVPRVGSNGEFAGYIGSCMDITETKQAEQETRSAAEMFRSVVNHVVDAIITIDDKGTIESFNPAAERIFGFTTSEVVGRNVKMLMPEPYHREHDGYIGNYLRTGERKIIGIGREVSGRRKDGSTFPMDLAVSEFFVGERRHFTGIARDITDRKALERAREASAAELEQTLRYNEMFAGILAHDLRNPLGAIVTTAQFMLQRHDGQPEITKPVNRVVSSGTRMARMIQELLDFTRTRVGGGIDLELREADLAEVCGQAIGEIEAAHPEWKIRVDSIGDLRGTWDPDRLLQVISNLVANAGQHGMSGGAITLKLDGADGDSVGLQVHNVGSIPEALLPTLFAPFRGTRDRKSQGLGLGLYIARDIVVGHGGTIDVTSSDAVGTTFKIRLPRYATHRRSHEASSASRDSVAGTSWGSMH